MRILLTTLALALLLAGCGHRTALTLPNAKGKPPVAGSPSPNQPPEPEQP